MRLDGSASAYEPLGAGFWMSSALVALSSALVALALAVAALSVPTLLRSSQISTTATHARGLQTLPVPVRAQASAAIGSDEAAYRVHGLAAGNPAQKLQERFTRGGVVIGSGGAALSLRLVAVGRPGSLQTPPPTLPRTSANRVSYSHSGLTEWYANGPLGLEQGFDLSQRPSGQGKLSLALGVHGSLEPRLQRGGVVFVDRDGRTVLRYGGLLATDARGRKVQTGLSVTRGRLLLQVSDASATYPLRVDPMIQQGTKLVAPGNESGSGNFGLSVSLSGDGNTALIGGPEDNGRVGAAWVFTRSGSTWTQQQKLTAASGTETGSADFGRSVALSTDGNTALIGGINDNSSAGAAWVFTRSGSTWTQKQKLTAPDEVGSGRFGISVALSADGSTALIGGYLDNANHGAAWIFTRSGSSYGEQQKLIPTSGTETGPGGVGTGVSLSADGNTALVGGYNDNGGVGAAWAFTRSGSTWNQQQKLTAATGTETGAGAFGVSTALSADGNTALIGGDGDNSFIGAAWAFTRSGSTWTQQQKLTAATGTETGAADFGRKVALSADGNTALVGGHQDNSGIGAAWLFTRSGSAWTQHQKLTAASGTETGAGAFGRGVALSSDANTALIGGDFDNGAIGAAWVFVSAPHTLSVSLGGSGTGTVTSNPAGISCPGTCTGSFASGLRVNLAARPAKGSVFAGWTGACAGAGACTVTMSANQTVEAIFTKLPVAKITKAKIRRKRHTARFSFKATPRGTGFKCALISKQHRKPRWRRCRTPKIYHLKRGKYVFEVRAVSAAGLGPVVKRRFRI